jgi:hypothetical protein
VARLLGCVQHHTGLRCPSLETQHPPALVDRKTLRFINEDFVKKSKKGRQNPLLSAFLWRQSFSSVIGQRRQNFPPEGRESKGKPRSTGFS